MEKHIVPTFIDTDTANSGDCNIDEGVVKYRGVESLENGECNI